MPRLGAQPARCRMGQWGRLGMGKGERVVRAQPTPKALPWTERGSVPSVSSGCAQSLWGATAVVGPSLPLRCPSADGRSQPSAGMLPPAPRHAQGSLSTCPGSQSLPVKGM